MADFFSGPQNNRPQNQRKDLIRVMGLWEENDQNGNKMLTGTLSGRVKVNIVPNNFKKGDREPDYYLISEFLAEQGVEGIMIEDNQPLTEEEIRAMYIDIPLEMENVDDSAVVSFFLDS